MSMASRYNSSPLPAEVLVSGARAEVVRVRETYEALIEHEREPKPLSLAPTPMPETLNAWKQKAQT
jgi:hypothetical protein